MPKIKVNFKDAPPAQPGRPMDLLPEAGYRLTIGKPSADPAQGGTGRLVIKLPLTVTKGDQKGAQILQTFTLPKDGNDSQFGLQQFHALLIALGGKRRKGADTIELDDLQGRTFFGDVADDYIPARENKPEKQISRVVGFWKLGSKEQKEILKRNKAKASDDDDDEGDGDATDDADEDEADSDTNADEEDEDGDDGDASADSDDDSSDDEDDSSDDDDDS